MCVCLIGLNLLEQEYDNFYTHKKIQYEKYKLKCDIMKNESLSVVVSYINVVVNQTNTHKV